MSSVVVDFPAVPVTPIILSLLLGKRCHKTAMIAEILWYQSRIPERSGIIFRRVESIEKHCNRTQKIRGFFYAACAGGTWAIGDMVFTTAGAFVETGGVAAV